METPIPRLKRQLPDKIGRYRVIERLGKGAMGVVFSAYDDVMARRVAIKVMMADVQDDPETSTRFFREAHAAGQLVHRNIITIFDLGDDDGRPYIVMELLEGQTLGDYLKSVERMPLEDKVSLMLQVCDGLRLAHSKGIFHRDIKPGNLFVTTSGDLKILDFGIARLATSSMTMSGLIMGTPDYMSPEQACGREVDQRSDIFSAGAVFYLMLTGRKPFAAAGLPAVLMKVQNDDPLPIREIEAPPSLAAAVMKAMAKSPEARYQTAGELITDLNRVCRELAVQTSRISEQARVHFDALDGLAAERLALRRELGVPTESDSAQSFGETVRQQYPSIAQWLDGGKSDSLYRDAAQDVLMDVTAVHHALTDEIDALRRVLMDVEAGAAAEAAGDWVAALSRFDAAATAMPAAIRARAEADRLRRLLAEKQEADDRRRALLAEAREASERADWTAVTALAEEVLASDRDNAAATALQQQASTALAAETRRRRHQCEQAIARAEELARQGRYAEAEAAISETKSAYPDAPLVSEVAERIRTARLDADRASERERRSADAIAAARTMFSRGARAQALADLSAFLSQDPDAPGVAAAVRELSDDADRLLAIERRRAGAAEHVAAAQAALEADDPERALALTRDALRLCADDELARKIQGLASVRLREQKAAKDRADQAHELLQHARTLLQRRKYAAAREQAQSAANLMSSGSEAQALLTTIDEEELKCREDERREREAQQRMKAAAPVLAAARSAEAGRDYARAGWLAENALALDPACGEARQIIQRAQAKVSAEPERADDTVKMTGDTNRPADVEDTVVLAPSPPPWRRLAGVLRSWVHGAREGV